jgi:hypothetical protein
VKYYKWIDKNNWGLTDMDFMDSSTDSSTTTASHLIFQPSFRLTDRFTNLWNNMSNIYHDPNFQNTRHGLVIATKQLEPLSNRNGHQQGRWYRFFKHSKPESISENLKVDKIANRRISKSKNRPFAKFFKDYNGQKSKIHFRLSPHMSSNFYARKSRNEIDSTHKHSSKDLLFRDDNIFVKEENISELC